MVGLRGVRVIVIEEMEGPDQEIVVEKGGGGRCSSIARCLVA